MLGSGADVLFQMLRFYTTYMLHIYMAGGIRKYVVQIQERPFL